ncbi:uncharacterized protein LOC109837188 [Asparagus officinalis]|uniref:uncharacterized protein LOC109837188 n=1 Tax=Asparagus officinalis TaxID=4686 RepID=UPI00098E3B50|nr:uncharacterized protein LOC109837188 [Asparagus officinalis]
MAASSRNHEQVLKHTVRLFSPPRKAEGIVGPPTEEEFDEADVWCVQYSASKPDKRFPVHRPRSGRRTDPRVRSASGSCSLSNSGFDESKDDKKSSVPWSRSAWSKIKTGSGSGSRLGSTPVNIPDWPKIMLQELGFEEEGEEAIVPPHEVVMRRRAASLSVVEGMGRTLKGRDLSRVRNAIWAKTGFQD